MPPRVEVTWESQVLEDLLQMVENSPIVELTVVLLGDSSWTRKEPTALTREVCWSRVSCMTRLGGNTGAFSHLNGSYNSLVQHTYQ